MRHHMINTFKYALLQKKYPLQIMICMSFLISGFIGPVLPPICLSDTCGNIEKHCPSLPNWVKGAAKLLNTGEKGQDLQALANELGR